MKNFTVAFAGNPNVGKSTIFNSLTGMNQHTGNWSGKTVGNCRGRFTYKDAHFTAVDIPGTYSLMSNSEEEEIARNYICFENPDAIVIVVDGTSLERNLNLVTQIMEINSNIILNNHLSVSLSEENNIIIYSALFNKRLNILNNSIKQYYDSIADPRFSLEKSISYATNFCEKKIEEWYKNLH